MTVEKHTKNMYDTFGKEYQKNRIYNQYFEMPQMMKAVGNIKGKKLLDVGCGAGVHIKKYLAKGAKCWGIDLSKTMIGMAKKNCPKVDFKVGSIVKLPYNQSSFDIVTASLCMDYIEDLKPVFKEINRVLKKGGIFIFSDESPISVSKEVYENKKYKIVGVGKLIDKESGEIITFGRAWTERLKEWEMQPGMKMKTYTKTFRTQLRDLVTSGFELIDFIDCKPTKGFKKHDPKAYELYCKYPLMSIFVSRKK